MDDHSSLRQRAGDLLAAMTLEEKAGQITQYFYFTGWPPQKRTAKYANSLEKPPFPAAA